MATAMAACSRLGLKTAYLGSVGNDHNGRLIVSELGRRSVDVSHVLTRECPSRFAVITVDETSGDRIVLWDRDDRLNVTHCDIDRSLLGAARFVHVDDEDQGAAIAAAQIAREAGVPVTSDIDRITERTPELIAAVSIPVFAQHVLPEITGEIDVERALRVVRRSHAGWLCVTLGAAGAALLVDDQFFSSPALRITAVDTTGAGDVFRAAFIYAMLNNYSPPETLRFANAAAAVSCTRAGAMASVPAMDEVLELRASGA